MARPGVTYQDIASAVNELKGQGKNITIENIRSLLGTGSIGTINKYLRQWREIQTSATKIASKENLPEELVSLMKGLWEGVLTQSIQRFEPMEVNYQQEISDLKTELEKYKQNNQRWQKLFNQWQQEKMALANEKLTLGQALEFAHKEMTTLTTKQDGLHQQLQEKQSRIDELHRLHQQTQHNLEHYRESAREQRLLDQQQFEQQKQQLFTEMNTLKEELILQQQKAMNLQQKNHVLSESYQVLEKNHLQNLNEHEKVREALLTAEKMKQEYWISYQNYEAQNKTLIKTTDSQSKELIDAQTENKMLSKEFNVIKKDLINAQDQLKLISQEKWEIMQEKARIEGQLRQLQTMVTA